MIGPRIRIGADPEDMEQDRRTILKYGPLSNGRYTEHMEDAIELTYAGQSEKKLHAVAVNSCGSGLLAVLLRLREKAKKGIVAVSNNTFYATGGMAERAGFVVIPVDCGKDIFSMCPDALKEKITHVDGVVLTHVGGFSARYYKEIAELCRKHDKFLVEDGAHAFGVIDPFRGIPGTLGDAIVFSFYPTKPVPSSEGGAVLTKDKELADWIKAFRNYGKDNEGIGSGGMNLRICEFSAAVVYRQVLRLKQILAARERDGKKLMRLYPPHPDLKNAISNFYKYIIRKDKPLSPETRTTARVYEREEMTDRLMAGLERNLGLPHRRRQPYFPNCNRLAASHVCLPTGEGMYDNSSDEEIVEYIGLYKS